MKISQEKFKQYLVESDILSSEVFDEIAFRANNKLEDIYKELLSAKIITEEGLASIRANIAGTLYVNLENKKIPLNILKIIPEHIAKNKGIIAYKKSRRELEVAMLNPDDLETIDFIKKISDLNILPRFTTTPSLENALRQYHETLENEFEDMLSKDKVLIREISEGKEVIKDEDLRQIAKEIPIIKIVDTLIKHAIIQNSSDIHIEPQEKEVVVRYRIDGILHDATILPIKMCIGIVARIKIMSNLKLDEHRQPQDGRFKAETDNYRYSLRVSVLPTNYGEKVVIRLLKESDKIMDLEEIGVIGESLSLLEKNIKNPSGMILVTGPTGSGKTTTLYSILHILNSPDVNISTIEDPIEYEVSRINQTQVNAKIGFTFAQGLRALVRQDPDVIMVGEIRDNETANLVINAALTGHKVLSTLHTNDAAGAISRLTDMGIEPFLTASSLNVVVAQRLIRKLTDNKESYYLSNEEILALGNFCDLEKIASLLIEQNIIRESETLKNVRFYRPSKVVGNSNYYKGRVGIYEVMVVSEKIRELILKREAASKIKEQAQKEGMITIFEDGFIKAAKGITSIEEVLRIASQ